MVLIDLLEKINDWWSSGNAIEEDFVMSYELKWEANKKYRKELQKPPYKYCPTKDAKHPDLAFKSWRDYASTIKAYDRFEDGMELLDEAKAIFLRSGSLSKMTPIERKSIAGYAGRRQTIGTPQENIDWGCFGSMTGTGIFKELVDGNNKHLSNALDLIPADGEVTEIDYQDFVLEFKKAFKGKSRKGGIPTASRLLAMKRPDYFVCLNSRNKRELSKCFGFSQAGADLDLYWDLVIDPIIQSKWWNTKRPSGEDGKIWDRRAALLDMVFYVDP